MKSVLVGVTVLLVLGLTSRAEAAPKHATLNWGTNINGAACEKIGPPVINVTGKILHDVDSGLAGNWALDEINRSIQVWLQTDGNYCAIVRNSGQFDAQAGVTSPGTTGVLTGDEDGTFEGGYTLIIDGVLATTPTLKTKGNIGTIDYQCNLAGTCPGYVSWLTQYFSTVNTYDYSWWGWIYHGVQDSWVNSSDGNTGDVF